MYVYRNQFAVVLIVCIGCYLSEVNCQVSWALIFVGLSAVCVWESFIMYITYTNKAIVWNQAQKTMILIAYFVPICFYLISLLVFKNTDFSKTSQICLIKFNQRELIMYQILQGFFFFLFQVIFLVFTVIDSIKSLRFIERQKTRFKFLEGSFVETFCLPISTSILFISYFLSLNLQYWLDQQEIEVINNICTNLVLIGLLIVVIQYGYNPTVLRVTTLKQIYRFRSRLEQKYLAKLMEGSGTTFFGGSFSESELGNIEQIQYNQFK